MIVNGLSAGEGRGGVRGERVDSGFAENKEKYDRTQKY